MEKVDNEDSLKGYIEVCVFCCVAADILTVLILWWLHELRFSAPAIFAVDFVILLWLRASKKVVYSFALLAVVSLVGTWFYIRNQISTADRYCGIVTIVGESYWKGRRVYFKTAMSDPERREYATDYDIVRYKKGDQFIHEFLVLDNGEVLLDGYDMRGRKLTDTNLIKYSSPVKIVDGKEIGNGTFNYFRMEPEIAYENFGCNIVYKAVLDSIGNLRLTDVSGRRRTIKYASNSNTSVTDTFLVFSNMNEAIDDRFIVCAREVNTPQNRAKISDYGFIFLYDVYSKEEIESQCPQIMNYIEKYKERMLTK